MKKMIFLLLSACLLNIGQTEADNVLTVSDINVPQGGQALLEIGCEFDTEYTAFELQLSLPEGLSLLTDEYGYPVIEKAFDTNHILTGNLLPSNGNYKITCRSMDNLSIPTSGVLFRVTIQANASLALGTNHAASVTACEFTRTADSQGENLSDVSFTIHITEFRTILDETSTTIPVGATDVNVRVNRTIKANEWSTICLPFAMTETQVKTAFGDDVQIGDFSSWSSEEDAVGDIVAISLGFTSVNAIEANHPYIIKVSSDIIDFTVDGVTIDAEEEPTKQVGTKKAERGYFIGTYTANTYVPEDDLFLNNNKFWYSKGNTKMKAFRGYFELADVLTSVEEASAPVFITFDSNTTGIQNSKRDMIDNNSYYNLNGQRVSHPSKGLYIINNKKIVIR